MANFITACSIFIALCLPIAYQLLGIETNNTNAENRILAKLSDLKKAQTVEFPKLMNHILNDNIPFRQLLIKKSNLLRSLYLKQPGDHVVVGADNWLFYKGDDIFEDLMGQRRFTVDGKEEWLASFEEKQRLLGHLGIGYFLVSIPNKSSVHYEKLPLWIKANRSSTRMRELYFENIKLGRFSWLNLENKILDLKAEQIQTYWFNDTHWSGHSFLLGLAEIFSHAQQTLPLLNVNEFLDKTSIVVDRDPGDLSALMGLSDSWPRGDRHKLSFVAPPDLVKSETKISELSYYENIPGNHPTYPIALERKSGVGTVVIFHDSFLRVASSGQKWEDRFPIALPFKRCVLIWSRPNIDEIRDVAELEKPDLIIEERVERLLYKGNNK